jgi:alpha-galactosidase
MSNETKELYLNKDMIAINQDSLGVQGHRISDKNGKQVWTKPLKNGDIAVALLNNNSSTQTVECNFSDIGVEGEVEVRDAWKKKDLGPLSHVSIELPAHGSALLRLVVKPVPRGLFKGEALAIPGKIEMEDFDINGLGQGNTTYNENDTENHGDSDYRPGTGVDLYKKASGIIVGYNQAGEWLEYTVKVASTGTYTMNASVASANSTSSFQLSMDGKNITEEIAVPQATTGEDNYDEYNTVEAKVSLTEGEHILRFTVTGDWMDIDWIEFCAGDSCGEITGIRSVKPSTVRDASAVRLRKKGGQMFIEKNGKRFDLTGHRIK